MSGTTEAARAAGQRHDFTGKVAIVTGAAQGIGEAYARSLAAAGAAVVVADIAADAGQAVAKQICADGGRAAFVRTDVADPDSAQAMAEFAAGEFGGIDFLVNNAAIYGQMQFDLLLSVDWDYYKKFLGVNMDGALACTRACHQHMVRRGGGAIVNQSSTAAWVYSSFYGLAKAGINALTQQLAHELGGMGIRVNAIAPGPTDTQATQDRGRRHDRPDRGDDGHQAAGPARGPGGCVPVPAVGRGSLDHRADRQRRRRPGLPVRASVKSDGEVGGDPAVIRR